MKKVTSKRYHAIVDLSSCPAEKLNSVTLLRKFLKRLPVMIDMGILKGPVIAEGIPANPGLSGFVIIDYSHISVHTFTDSKEALIDIFSCKPYDVELVIKESLETFGGHRDNAAIRAVQWGVEVANTQPA